MNEKPTSITAAEFVAGDYEGKIAAGECKVWDGVRDAIEVKRISTGRRLSGEVYVIYWIVDKDIEELGIDNWRDALAGDTFEVEWLNQGAASLKDDENEISDAAALDHVSTQWVQLHIALSEALGLEFMPNEDVEQYTNAIATLWGDLKAERAENARLARELKAVKAALAEIERNAPVDEPINTGVASRNYAIAWAFWSAGQMIRNVLAGKAGEGE